MTRQIEPLPEHDLFFMEKALGLAEKALEMGEFPVGCVLVADGRVVAEGARLHTERDVRNELDHAEIMALRSWRENGMPGHDSHGGVTAYITLEPCLMCMGALILNGINRTVYALEDVMGGAAGLDFSRTFTAVPVESGSLAEDGRFHLYAGYDRHITGGVGRNRSLELFRAFFGNPDLDYWKESLLSRHILSEKTGS
jgi:tRNA(adenine34) deaminase